MMYDELMKNFHVSDSNEVMAVGLLSSKTLDSHFLDMMYVEFMKNYHLADSNEVMAVRLISAS